MSKKHIRQISIPWFLIDTKFISKILKKLLPGSLSFSSARLRNFKISKIKNFKFPDFNNFKTSEFQKTRKIKKYKIINPTSWVHRPSKTNYVFQILRYVVRNLWPLFLKFPIFMFLVKWGVMLRNKTLLLYCPVLSVKEAYDGQKLGPNIPLT